MVRCQGVAGGLSLPQVKCGIGDRGEGAVGAVVPVVEREIAGLVADPVPVHLIAPVDGAADGLGIGLEQQLVRVEPMAPPGVVGSVHAIGVELVREDVAEIAVPDLIRLLRQFEADVLGPAVGRLEQADLHLRRVLREHGEVDARPVPCGPEGIGGPVSHLH